MASVLNRLTKQLIVSANTPDFPSQDWIVNPDLSAVSGFASKYWTISGDIVSLMNQAARDAVDAVELSASRDALAEQLQATEDTLAAFALVVLDEINMHAARITAILDAVDGASNLATLKTAVAAIGDVPQRTIQQLKTALRAKLGG